MLRVKIECKLKADKLAKYLLELTKLSFKVWLFKGKTYAIFKINSGTKLEVLLSKLKDEKVKVKVLMVEWRWKKFWKS